MADLSGWTIVSDDDNGSLLVQSPQGHRRRIWRDETEEENQLLLSQVAQLKDVISVTQRERDEQAKAIHACYRYFEHCQRVSLSARHAGCDSGEMAVRLSLKEEARAAVMPR